jgi:hypothetical protein
MLNHWKRSPQDLISIEDLDRLSGEAYYWVVLDVTMLIFQSSPSRISIEE